MTPSTVTLQPAYGRDYPSAAEAREAWVSGVDWQISCTGQYCSVRDALSLPEVWLRYNGLTQKVKA